MFCAIRFAVVVVLVVVVVGWCVGSCGGDFGYIANTDQTEGGVVGMQTKTDQALT
jgi:hypothetical protein